MSESERSLAIIAMLEKFDEHIDRVTKTVRTLSKRLITSGDPKDEKLAFLLRRSAYSHDKSKLEGCEWPWIHQTENKEALIHAIQHHQQVNQHHPEQQTSIRLWFLTCSHRDHKVFYSNLNLSSE